jgi:hypothetical protein
LIFENGQTPADGFRRLLIRLRKNWILLTFACAALGWALAAAIVPYTLGISVLFSGLLAGVLVALAQGRVLEVFLPQLDWLKWKSFSFLGSLLASPTPFLLLALFQLVFPDGRDDPLGRVLLILAASIVPGIVFGLTQWLVLRRYVVGAWHWVWANATGAVLGGSLGWAVATLVNEGLIPSELKGAYITGLGEALWLVIAGSIATGSMGLVTGYVLTWLLGRSPEISSCFVEQLG